MMMRDLIVLGFFTYVVLGLTIIAALSRAAAKPAPKPAIARECLYCGQFECCCADETCEPPEGAYDYESSPRAKWDVGREA